MMRGVFYLIVFSSALLFSHDRLDLNQIAPGRGPIAVSLGGWCDPAGLTRLLGHRKASFPLDWIVSANLEKVTELIDDGFLHFFDDNCLDVVAISHGGHVLVNHYYSLEFIHDGEFIEPDYHRLLDEFKTKYQRRIERFHNLASYKGKVYFIRTNYPYFGHQPIRHTRLEEHPEISESAALKLYEVLKKRFPSLDFTLIILNEHDRGELEFEQRLNNGLFMLRMNSHLEAPQRMDHYHLFFQQLMREDGF